MLFFVKATMLASIFMVTGFMIGWLLGCLLLLVAGGIMAERLTGVVKFFNSSKGYGFIAMEDRDDVFVHKNDLVEGLDRLNERDKVSFYLGKGNKGGECAMDVKLA